MVIFNIFDFMRINRLINFYSFNLLGLCGTLVCFCCIKFFYLFHAPADEISH